MRWADSIGIFHRAGREPGVRFTGSGVSGRKAENIFTFNRLELDGRRKGRRQEEESQKDGGKKMDYGMADYGTTGFQPWGAGG